MQQNAENAVNNDDLLTLNQVAEITGGHYQTIKKIIERMADNNEVEIGSVYRQNREFKAYRLNNLKIAEIQTELKRVKSSLKPLKTHVNANNKNGENAVYKSKIVDIANVVENDSVKMLENASSVKFYEVVKKNNELENKISMLEATIKDKDIELANQKSKLTSENTQLQAELYKVQADVKLITDKSSTMEAAWAEEKLKVESLQKQLSNRNIALIILGAIILTLATIFITIMTLKSII